MSVSTHIIYSTGFMAILGSALASVLAIANRRLYVYEDPRIEQVEDMLPHTNCGACGTAGCRAFAEALIEGAVKPGECTVNNAETSQEIADFLGVDLGQQEKRTARLACAGGSHVARMRAHYDGLASCRAADVISGGAKACTWGCLGLGDCEDVCEFDAIQLDQFGLPVVDVDLCTACGDCVDICPKQLFSIEPVSHRLWVACKNQDHGDAAESLCEVACNACERCAVDAPESLIIIKDNLAIIDYSKNKLATDLPIQRCPTGAIVWLDENQHSIKGVKAKKVIRNTPLPLAETKTRG